MVDIYRSFVKRDLADMWTIYIEEAHARDEWYLPDASAGKAANQPTTTAERIRAAAAFASDFRFPIPVYVDTISDHAGIRYDAWPERLYVVVDGVVVYKGGPGPFQYRLGEVKAWLEGRFGHHAPLRTPGDELEGVHVDGPGAADAATCGRVAKPANACH